MPPTLYSPDPTTPMKTTRCVGTTQTTRDEREVRSLEMLTSPGPLGKFFFSYSAIDVNGPGNPMLDDNDDNKGWDGTRGETWGEIPAW